MGGASGRSYKSCAGCLGDAVKLGSREASRRPPGPDFNGEGELRGHKILQPPGGRRILYKRGATSGVTGASGGTEPPGRLTCRFTLEPSWVWEKCVVGFGSYDGTRTPHFQVPGGCVKWGFTLQPSVFFESPCCVLWVLRGLSVVVFYGPRGACTMGLASAAVCVVGISLSCFGGPRSPSEAVFYGLRGDRKMGLHCSRSGEGATSVVIITIFGDCLPLPPRLFHRDRLD